MTTLNTFQAQLRDTQRAMNLMMNIDSYSEKNREVINSAFSAIVQEESYINKIKEHVHQICADGEFTIADIPDILMIIAQSQSALKLAIRNSINLKVSLEKNSMKYIVFAILHFILLVESVSTGGLDRTFGSLWDLLAFDPSEVSVGVKSCFSCCSSTQTKTSKGPNQPDQ